MGLSAGHLNAFANSCELDTAAFTLGDKNNGIIGDISD